MILAAEGQEERVGEEHAEERGDEGGGDELAQLGDLAAELAEHVDEAEHGAEHAQGRGVAAELVEEVGPLLPDRLGRLGLHDHDQAGLFERHAVDDELQAPLQHHVVLGLDLRLEGEGAVLAGDLGVRTDLLDHLAGGVLHVAEQLADRLQRVERPLERGAGGRPPRRTPR